MSRITSAIQYKNDGLAIILSMISVVVCFQHLAYVLSLVQRHLLTHYSERYPSLFKRSADIRITYRICNGVVPKF